MKDRYLKIFCISIIIIFSLALISGQDTKGSPTPLNKYCCEKTNYGAWCQEAPQEQCNSQYRKNPTSCEATSFCKLGCCYDSTEGVCMESTPQKACDNSGGTWADSKQCEIPQCKPGCCVLGTQASFTTLTRCKKLSSFYGLETDYRPQIQNEIECIGIASLGDEGACVFELDYGGKTCKFTSRQECNSFKSGGKVNNGTVTSNTTFYKDYLCSADELGANCGPTKQTTCLEGKDEVYFVDSCGNPANIYDSSKVNDKAYWRKKISKAESCGKDSMNVNSPSCGNCDYFAGSLCGDYKSSGGNKPSYGSLICRDLNCKKTSDGKSHKHGESWCGTDKFVDAVGSKYYRHLCMNGEEMVEPCADFRQEICIEDAISSKGVKFSQAACRVNRWQDCLKQIRKIDCENTDKRDCVWNYPKDEVKTIKTETPATTRTGRTPTAGTGGFAGNGSTGGFGSTGTANTVGGGRTSSENNPPKELACFPKHSPGLNFWEEGTAQTTCSQANKQCVVTYEKKGLIFSRGESCVDNCECLDQAWVRENLQKCNAIGDCGNKVNFLGIPGFDEGYKITKGKINATG